MVAFLVVFVCPVVPMPVKHRTSAVTVIMVIIPMQLVLPVTHHSNWHIKYIHNVSVVAMTRIFIKITRLCNRGS